MMKNIKTIFKKEFDRVMKDKRLIFTIMFLPGLMLFLVYSFIGSALENATTKTPYHVAIVNPVVEFMDIYEPNETDYILNVISISEDDVDEYQARIDDEEWELLLYFDDSILTYDGTGDKPVIWIYSNQNNMNSSAVYSRFVRYLSQFQATLSYDLYGDTTFFTLQFDGTEVDQNLQIGTMISSIMPMLVVMFLFSGAMSIGPESIAGEKERNTISTLLITPVKRSEIAIGKIFSLSMLSLLSAVSSFIGILFSLPKLLDIQGSSYAIYSVLDYLMILALLFSTVFVIVGAISIISAFSKSVKEASTMVIPLYILTILVGITSLFNSSITENPFMYILPIYNTVQTLSAIMTFNPRVVLYLVITICSNLVYLGLFVYFLEKMFQSEKIMFSK